MNTKLPAFKIKKQKDMGYTVKRHPFRKNCFTYIKFKHLFAALPNWSEGSKLCACAQGFTTSKGGGPCVKMGWSFWKMRAPRSNDGFGTNFMPETSDYMCGRRLKSVVSTWYLHFESQIHLRVGNREFQVQQVTFQWSIYWWASQNRRCCREKIIGIGGVCDFSRVKSVTICPGASFTSLGRGVGVLYKPSKTNMNHWTTPPKLLRCIYIYVFFFSKG